MALLPARRRSSFRQRRGGGSAAVGLLRGWLDSCSGTLTVHLLMVSLVYWSVHREGRQLLLSTTLQPEQQSKPQYSNSSLLLPADHIMIRVGERREEGFLSEEWKRMYDYRPAKPRPPPSPSFESSSYYYDASSEKKKEEDDECGDWPRFGKWLVQQQQQGAGGDGDNRRSRKNEDRILYETFFRRAITSREATMRDSSFAYVDVLGLRSGSDGVHGSNSRFFDVCLGWKGLIVEVGTDPDPKAVYPLLLKRNRPHAHLLNFAAAAAGEAACGSGHDAVEEDEGLLPAVNNKTFGFPMTNHPDENNNEPTDDVVVRVDEVPCGSLTPAIRHIFGPEGRVHVLFLDASSAAAGTAVAEPMMLVVERIIDDLERVHVEMLVVDWHRRGEPPCNEKGGGCDDDNAHARRRRTVRERMGHAGYALHDRLIPGTDVFLHPSSSWNDEEALQGPAT